MKNLMFALTLIFSVNTFAFDVLPGNKSDKEYVEVVNKTINGKEMVSFRLCFKDQVPCTSRYLGKRRWYSKTELSDQMNWEIAQAVGAGVFDAAAAAAVVYCAPAVAGLATPVAPVAAGSMAGSIAATAGTAVMAGLEGVIALGKIGLASSLTTTAVFFKPVNVVAQGRQAATLRSDVISDKTVVLDWKEDSVLTFSSHLDTVLSKLN